MTEAGVVIIGGGQGGFQVADSLRSGKYAGPVTIVSDEPGLPYQRPPLSKAYLVDPKATSGVLLRPASYYERHDITLVHGRAADIDRVERRVVLADGRELAYDHVVLATGARPRRLSLPGSGWDGVHELRSLTDARVLTARLADAEKVVVIGAGVIGMEFASAAAKLGRDVTLVEPLDRPMARMASHAISDFFVRAHTEHGVQFRFGQGARGFVPSDHGEVAGVLLTDGEVLPADLVVVAVGVVPNTEVAEKAGLEVSGGIVVDETLVTSDPAISALGDCVVFPLAETGTLVRLESVQNAVDHARCIAGRLVGKPKPYDALPWFWSEQQGFKLQIAGLFAGVEETVVHGDPGSGSLSVYGFRAGRLQCVESINRPLDHLAARRLLAAGHTIAPTDVTEEFDLPSTAKALLAAGR